MQFTQCENTGFFLRMGLVGPSGSGKTYTALKVATELGYQKVGILDTENRSARRYARSFSRRFLALELDRFSPQDYIAGIRAAVDAGVEVLIIDSLSHAWMGKGGVLEMVDQSARRQSRGGASGSSFNGWREVTPEHNRLVEALIHAPLHLIVTMRVKTDYIVEKDDKGKSVPRKVGLAPVQRDGLEYEFDVIAEISPEHEAVITKSRCPDLADQVLARPGTELARTLRGWLDGAGPTPPQERPCPPTTAAPSATPTTTTARTTTPAAAPSAGAPGAPSGGSVTPATPTTTAPATDPDADADWRGYRCDDCGAPIVWVHTRAGQPVAVQPRRRDRPADVVDDREQYDLQCHKPHRPVCTVRPGPAPADPREPDPVQGQAAIVPWLQKIDDCKTLEALDAVRTELNATLKRRTQMQGETLRRAIEATTARIRGALANAQQVPLAGTATAGPPRELRIERDPQDPQDLTSDDDQPIGLVPVDHP